MFWNDSCGLENIQQWKRGDRGRNLYHGVRWHGHKKEPRSLDHVLHEVRVQRTTVRFLSITIVFDVHSQDSETLEGEPLRQKIRFARGRTQRIRSCLTVCFISEYFTIVLRKSREAMEFQRIRMLLNNCNNVTITKLQRISNFTLSIQIYFGKFETSKVSYKQLCRALFK